MHHSVGLLRVRSVNTAKVFLRVVCSMIALIFNGIASVPDSDA